MQCSSYIELGKLSLSLKSPYSFISPVGTLTDIVHQGEPVHAAAGEATLRVGAFLIAVVRGQGALIDICPPKSRMRYLEEEITI